MFKTEIHQTNTIFYTFRHRFLTHIISDTYFIGNHIIKGRTKSTVRIIQDAKGRHLLQLGKPILPCCFRCPIKCTHRLVLKSQQQLHPYILSGFFLQVFIQTRQLRFHRSCIIFQLLGNRCRNRIFSYLPTVATAGTQIPYIGIQLIKQSRNGNFFFIHSSDSQRFLRRCIHIQLYFSSFRYNRTQYRFSIPNEIHPFIIFGR